MTRNVKTKVAGRGTAKASLTILLMFVILGALASFLTLPDYMEKLGAARAVPEVFAGCGIFFLLGAFFWGLIKWIRWMGKKSGAAARWFLENWPVITVFGLVLRLPVALLIAAVPPMLFGLLASPLWMLTLYLAREGVSFLNAAVLLLLSGVLVLGLLIWDICFLATRKAG